MITFEPFWQQMKYKKHNHNYTLNSLDRFCHIFECQPCDLISYKDMGEIYLPYDLFNNKKTD